MIRTILVSGLIGLAALDTAYASDERGEQGERHHYRSGDDTRMEAPAPLQSGFRQELERQGYEVLRAKRDHGRIEVYASRNGEH